MVIRRTPLSWLALPRLALLRLALLPLGLALLGLPGCTSIDGPTRNVDQWKKHWSKRATEVKDGAARGAEAVGDSLGTAYRGVRDGFEDPRKGAYGPYPKGYAEAIRSHMLRFEGVPQDASFRFGKPERGYINRGILAGGEIEWQGWLVDMEIETTSFAGQKRTKAYVVRMTDGEVVEVVDAAYAGAIHRLSQEPASRAK